MEGMLEKAMGGDGGSIHGWVAGGGWATKTDGTGTACIFQVRFCANR